MTTPEDPEIRELVNELVAAAPVAPPLPDAPVVRSMRRARRTVVAAIAFASVMALVAGGVWLAGRDKPERVIVTHPPTSAPSSASAPTTTIPPTTTSLVNAIPELPRGTAFIGLDRNTGDVMALDENAHSLTTLFNGGVEATHHWPTLTQFQLTPDAKTLWYAANPNAQAPCSAIIERDLTIAADRARFRGSWMALSPDGTRLAYAGCIDQDPTVYIVDVGTGDTWTARAPATALSPTPLGRLTWTADGKQVLAEYRNDAGKWPVVALTPTGAPGPIGWGPTVLTLDDEDRLTTTPTALLVSAAKSPGQWAIDKYDWTFHRVSETPTNLGQLEIVLSGGRTFAVGGPFTGGSGYDTGLYRLETNGTLTQIRHGIGEIVAVPPTG